MANSFVVGDLVVKSSGDYAFCGHIVAVFNKRAKNGGLGPVRLVVQDDRGLLMIMNPAQIELVNPDTRS